ncbi:M42 family metallopeptidase [Alicyclobacillus tolerans]|uniref:M42 family metallopeptidase n=1 Tax=Alicyclobacillus tolerans TaxID=90970 RepID=UPI001F3B92A5|nr:M42 family metallopeptidase [Alicyclobacillus tolerans]MCF8563755.1 M42 family metallopeptidase [Alicyclobacillus tolerans]
MTTANQKPPLNEEPNLNQQPNLKQKPNSNHKPTLLNILDSHGGPGFEHEVAEKMRQAFREYTDDVRQDALGNLIAVVQGNGENRRPKVMLSAHMDEIALVVTKIEDGGFLRVWQAGGFDPRTLVGQEVVVHGKEELRGIVGSKPPHLTTPEERKQAAPLEDLYIDLAMSEQRVNELVRVGDRVTLYRETMDLLNNRISGKALDDRTSLAVLLECLRFLKQMKHVADVYAVATVQEEVGVRGATTAGYGVHPDIAIAVDVTFADMPGQAPDDSFKMGKGPAVAFGPNIHPKVFQGLMEAAQSNHIPYQLELSQGPTGTDARAFQIAREGIASGLVGIAIRYMHTSVETGSYDDIVELGRLLACYIASVDSAYVEGLTCY